MLWKAYGYWLAEHMFLYGVLMKRNTPKAKPSIRRNMQAIAPYAGLSSCLFIQGQYDAFKR
jgi:hypothetical protein